MEILMTRELVDAIIRLKQFDGTSKGFYFKESELRECYTGNSFEEDLKDAMTMTYRQLNLIYSDPLLVLFEVPDKNTIGIGLMGARQDSSTLYDELEKRNKQGKSQTKISEIASIFGWEEKRANLAARRLQHDTYHIKYEKRAIKGELLHYVTWVPYFDEPEQVTEKTDYILSFENRIKELEERIQELENSKLEERIEQLESHTLPEELTNYQRRKRKGYTE
jgi:hypothetical protein